MKTKNILNGALVYLAGPIDSVDDDGVGWRKHFITECHKKQIGIIFLDPTSKTDGFTKEIGEDKQNLLRLKKEGKFDELSKIMKNVVRVDLRSVDISDFLIVRIDPSVFMCGSFDELRCALNEKKPVLIIIEGGKKKAPNWLFGIVDYKFMFDSVDECIDYLNDLNTGKTLLSSKWVLMRTEILKRNRILISQMLKEEPKIDEK
jgi:hypothetical protein